MSPKKRKRPSRAETLGGPVPPGELRAAIRVGKRRATETFLTRERQRRRRGKAVAGLVRTFPARASQERASISAAIRPSMARVLGARPSAGVLIAEGDSWFDYPLHDVLKMLDDEHGFDIESVAHHGDRVENMAYAPGQLEEFTRRIEKVLSAGTVPRAILLSGGGNDIAGDEFGVLLNHAASPIAGLNDDVVTGVIDRRIRSAYVTVIAAVTEICRRYLTRPVPIITHGYAYPVPDGRGFLGGFWFLPGPWLQPGFREKGYGNLAGNTAIMQDLIDRFNVMVRAASSAFAHVRYLDLRGLLTNGPRYKRSWANELHPTAAGFSAIADAFASCIDGLP